MKAIIAAAVLVVVVVIVAMMAFLGLPPFSSNDVEEQPGTITYPTNADTLSAGETYTLRWTNLDSDTPTQIFLIDTRLEAQGASASVVDRVDNVPNTGSYEYTVPAVITPGTYVFTIGTRRSAEFTINNPGASTADLETYTDTELDLTVQYPDDFILDEEYTYNDLGDGVVIEGVRFTIPESMATGTNLSSDSFVAIETMPDVTTCDASSFVPEGTATSSVTDNGQLYSFATTTDAGAGNRYEEMIYAIPGTDPCLAVRYFIHYTALENYEEGTVTEFNRTDLIAIFDQIRRSLTITQ